MVGGEEGGGRLLLSSRLINDFFQNLNSLFFQVPFLKSSDQVIIENLS